MTKKRIQFVERIEAPRDRVYSLMIGQDSYKMWTAPFAEGSHYEGSWDQGQRIHFFDQTKNGMISEVVENRPHEFISVQHLGMIQDGVEDFDSDMIKAWTPAYENYTFEDADGGTRLTIDIDVTDQFEEYMMETWPKALQSLKEICEVPA